MALIMATVLTVFFAVPLFSADLRPDYQPAAYAIKGAKVVPVAGEPIEPGTVVVRDGVIAAVGPVDRVEVPFDAEVIDGKGMVVYPGFIDLYATSGQAAGAVKSLTGPGRDVNYADFALPRTPVDNRNGITPEYEVARSLEMGSLADDRRKLGFTDVLVAPGGAIATGQSALVSTGPSPVESRSSRRRSRSTSRCGAPEAGRSARATRTTMSSGPPTPSARSPARPRPRARRSPRLPGPRRPRRPRPSSRVVGVLAAPPRSIRPR